MTYQEIRDLIDLNLSSGSKIPAVNHRAVEYALLDFIQSSASQSGDVKRVKSDIAYLNDNFEVNGLGKNLRLGWAICNGNNGTDNLAGRVGVGYGIGYSALGTLAGEDKHTLLKTELPNITVRARGSNADNGDTGNLFVTANVQENTGLDLIVNAGGGLSHNNMQPYIINLYIMKL
jgi:hypothetical protein